MVESHHLVTLKLVVTNVCNDFSIYVSFLLVCDLKKRYGHIRSWYHFHTHLELKSMPHHTMINCGGRPSGYPEVSNNQYMQQLSNILNFISGV